MPAVMWAYRGRSPAPPPTPREAPLPGSVRRRVREDTAPARRSDPVTAREQRSEVGHLCRKRPALGFLDASERLFRVISWPRVYWG